jgi:hypothetical protein
VQADANPGAAAWDRTIHGGPTTPGDMSLELKGLGTLLLIGVGLLVGSGVFLSFHAKHLTHGERAIGRVVGHKAHYNRRARKYLPVVVYVARGQGFRVTGKTAAAMSMYPMDKEVSVLYLPDDPGDAVIADFMQLYLAPTIVGGIGLVVILGAVGLGSFAVARAGWFGG